LDKAVVYEKLKEIMISELGLDAHSISPEKRLYDDLQLDSLDMIDLILNLDDYTGEKIDSALFNGARTVQDLVNSVHPLWKRA
jgi:acyl carrier protein